MDYFLEPVTQLFKDLSIGDVFSIEGRMYIKIDTDRAFYLTGNHIISFATSSKIAVQKRKYRLTIE